MMSGFNDSLRFRESLTIDDGALTISNKLSARIIGEVTIEEYDPLGNLISKSVDRNDITSAGATFILEQLFKVKSGNYRFLNKFNPHEDSSFKLNADTVADITTEATDISNERIFGFMVGYGGETASGVIAPSVTDTQLSKFIPFRLEDTTTSELEGYELPIGTTINNSSYTGFYVKKFTDNTVTIIPEDTATGEVIATDGTPNSGAIYTYAKLVMDIDGDDTRDYFVETTGGTKNCLVNQIGLVAGNPTDNGWNDIKLVTILNFRGRYLNNKENTLKFTYKLYCM